VYAQFHGEDALARIDPLQWRAAGIDGLVVRVFRNQSDHGGLLFENPEFRVIKPMLSSLVQRSQSSGASIWAWMIARRFDWVEDPRFLDCVFRSGRLETIRSLDLFNPDAVKRVLAVYRQLAQSGISGILIQDDLIIRNREGLSSWGRARYVLESGTPAHIPSMLRRGSSDHAAWIDTKTRRVCEVLTGIVKSCKSVNPDIRIGLNLYYETPLDSVQSREWYAHDLDLLLTSGVDRVFLMAYHRQMAAELNLTFESSLELFSRLVKAAAAVCGEKLVVKIQWRDWQSDEWIPDAEMDAVLDRLPAQVNRVCLTPVAAEDLPRMRRLLARRGWRILPAEAGQ
jgi:biofilm PGA synthesis lipoprotein PgaB